MLLALVVQIISSISNTLLTIDLPTDKHPRKYGTISSKVVNSRCWDRGNKWGRSLGIDKGVGLYKCIMESIEMSKCFVFNLICMLWLWRAKKFALNHSYFNPPIRSTVCLRKKVKPRDSRPPQHSLQVNMWYLYLRAKKTVEVSRLLLYSPHWNWFRISSPVHSSEERATTSHWGMPTFVRTPWQNLKVK